MIITMEDYSLSSDIGHDNTEWQLLWRITLSVLTLDVIKLTDKWVWRITVWVLTPDLWNWITITMDDYSFSSDTGHDKTEWQWLWRITLSVMTLDMIKLNNNYHGGLLFQFCHWTWMNECIYIRTYQSLWRTTLLVQNWMTITMEDYSFSLNTEHDETGWQSLWRITVSVLTLDMIKLNDNDNGGLLFEFWHPTW